uniref:Uncharacterized protein n=1 Tax=Candidatus Kentrum sp. TC TaxID=2126339 RepID=A0A450YEG6_9GAMM|nr:MAG: hypothetical protein BECKTC1821D_GA0114238_100722 [Candidatus Kentron sp. TC]VFK57182.1 MAG: hypothetical protein BECKTC1821F_GA0114240_101522 [Candidatus Kentron sp. TC]
MLYETDFYAWANRQAALPRAGNFLGPIWRISPRR